MNDGERAAELLGQLIAIESVNPDMPGGRAGENDYGDFVAGFGARIGLAVTRQLVVDGRKNVLLALDGGHPNTLLFDIHLDTVPQEGELGSARPVREGQRLYGRGACDVKGAMAAALLMLERLVAHPPPVNLILAGVVDEEYRKRGAHHLAADVSADAVIVGEPTGLAPVIAQKGILRFGLTASGKSAHTANPELGSNAIYAMLDAIADLRTLPDQIMPAHPHGLCGEAKLTVSTISGGVQVNVVPASCRAMVDRRMLPGEDPMAVHRTIRDLLAANPEILVEDPYAAEPGVESDPAAPIVRAAMRACQPAGQVEPIGVPYSTDAAAYAPRGLDFVVLGPGDIAQAHSAREYVELGQVAACVNLYEDVVRRYAQGMPH